MSLDHILLGMLDRPASGYDLGQEFEQSARMFWFAELSQIYPTLRRMESRGLLVSSEVASRRGPKRRVYERTEAGTAALHDWLRDTPKLRTARLEYVGQLYFLGQLGDLDESVRFVEALRAQLEAQRAAYHSIEERRRLECDDPADGSDIEFHHDLTLRAGMHVVEARLAWCEETLAALRDRIASRTREPEAAGAASGA